MNQNSRQKPAGRKDTPGAKRRRVLRARDVIPPFDKCELVPSSDEAQARAEQPPAGPASAGNKEGGSESHFRSDEGKVTAAPLPVRAEEVPEYDLAENILAEQRRAVGRRRRRPGRAEDEPVALPRQLGVALGAPDRPAQDLLELQRVVAEIVARDIERLCRPAERQRV